MEAMYDFIAENSSELSVREGERVTLVCPYDTSGYKEWWLVRDKAGQEGYVAASYFTHPHTEGSGYS